MPLQRPNSHEGIVTTWHGLIHVICQSTLHKYYRHTLFYLSWKKQNYCHIFWVFSLWTSSRWLPKRQHPFCWFAAFWQTSWPKRDKSQHAPLFIVTLCSSQCPNERDGPTTNLCCYKKIIWALCPFFMFAFKPIAIKGYYLVVIEKQGLLRLWHVQLRTKRINTKLQRTVVVHNFCAYFLSSYLCNLEQ